MKNKYKNLIEQTFEFPTNEFKTEDGNLFFNGISLMDIIKQYGTPLRLTYLPKIKEKIKKTKNLFNVAMAKAEYTGTYKYFYSTRSSYFPFILEEVLKNNVHIEISSAFDIPIIEILYGEGKIKKDSFIICNGYKRLEYINNILKLIEKGFDNVIPILDNELELKNYNCNNTKKMKIGIRIAPEEEPTSDFYTSRFGIRYNDIIPYYKKEIKNNTKFELKMLYFSINSGIRDSAYYWNELTKCVNLYCELKSVCPQLNSLNIGGDFPIKNSLNFDFDYEYISEEIIAKILSICKQNGTKEPDIFTDFGSFTIGECGATLYSIISQKRQNDLELWDMIDSSFITTLPFTWASNQKFILLAINHWDMEYERVSLGGITCDSMDYYNSEAHTNAIFLPKLMENDPLYIGLFHTGAYQDSISGYGGIQHCLIPTPKQIIIDIDENGSFVTKLFAKEQGHKSMLKILGY